MDEKRDLMAGHRQRLRERFLKAGFAGFHDYEMVELLLTYAIPRRDVKPIAKTLIERFRGIRGILDASVEELSEVPGVGENAAVLIRLLKELSCEYLRVRVVGSNAVSSPGEVINYLKAALASEKVEKFLALYLNAKNEVLALDTLHEGTIDQTAVYPRKVIERALKHNAKSIIFVHNHPSGDPTPSARDRALTDELRSAARAVDILVHDHIIIGRNSHVSGRTLGWLGGK